MKNTAADKASGPILCVAFALSALHGCATTSNPEAEAALAAVEQTLLAAPVLRVGYVVEANGAIDALLHGDLVVQKPAMAAITAHGSFAGRGADLELVSDGEQVRGGNGEQRFESPVPVALHDGLLVGLVRMGVLHNLAMLSGGAAPDATDGSAREWVQASALNWIEDEELNPAWRGIGFDIAVGGEPSGQVRLWFDANTNLPVRREQTVHFDSGDMNVVETYNIEVDGIVGPCRFKLAN